MDFRKIPKYMSNERWTSHHDVGCCEDLAGIQMINMSANRLGARFVYMKIIFKLIKMKFRNNMVSTLSRLLKN